MRTPVQWGEWGRLGQRVRRRERVFLCHTLLNLLNLLTHSRIEDRNKWLILEKTLHALAGLLSWLKRHPVHQKAVGWIAGQGTYLGFGFDSQTGMYWTQPMDVSLSLSSINIPLGED